MAKQYEVIGRATVEGHKPGEKFHADLDPAHEARMLRGGFLRVVLERTKPAAPEAAKKPAGAGEKKPSESATLVAPPDAANDDVAPEEE